METMIERLKHNRSAERRMQNVFILLPEHVIDDLKEVAPTVGVGSYQALIPAYISQGLWDDLARLKSERSTEVNKTFKDFSVVSEVSATQQTGDAV